MCVGPSLTSFPSGEHDSLFGLALVLLYVNYRPGEFNSRGWSESVRWRSISIGPLAWF